MANQPLKLNDQDSVDVDYYIRIARQQRSEYIAQLAASLKGRIKSYLHMALPKLSTGH